MDYTNINDISAMWEQGLRIGSCFLPILVIAFIAFLKHSQQEPFPAAGKILIVGLE